MNLLNIDNLSINKGNYYLSLEIKEKRIYSFFARDNKLLKELFLKISGINYSENVYFNNKLVYENGLYFNSRIYYNSENYFFKTIYPNVITNNLLNKYALEINQNKLEEVINDLWIRSECEIKGECKFTPIGNTLINFAFISSVDKPFLFVNNPTINLKDKKHIQYITSNIKDMSNDRTIVLGINNLSHFNDKLDRLWVFTDYDHIVFLDINKVKVSIVSGEARGILDVINEESRLFYTYKNDIFQLIFINNLERDELKELNRMKCRIDKINIYDIEKYM